MELATSGESRLFFFSLHKRAKRKKETKKETPFVLKITNFQNMVVKSFRKNANGDYRITIECLACGHIQKQTSEYYKTHSKHCPLHGLKKTFDEIYSRCECECCHGFDEYEGPQCNCGC